MMLWLLYFGRRQKVIGETVSRSNGEILVITTLHPRGNKGGQGTVYDTNNSALLIKVWDPSDVGDSLEVARADAGLRYRTFAELGFSTEAELTCLPLEYVQIGDRPAYIMQRAT